jgi:hypothetical protein
VVAGDLGGGPRLQPLDPGHWEAASGIGAGRRRG